MRYLSLFSGIEAATNAWHEFGTPVAFSEIEPFPCAVLAHHYPEVPNLGDVTKITEEQIKSLGAIDLVVFGSPCQDLSLAGKRKGFINADGNITRSGLFFDALNIAHWARKHCGCRFALWENVPGAFSSSKGADFTQVVSLMAGLDDLDTPKNGWGTEGAAVGDEGLLEWAVLDAQWFGVAQRRKRVFALVDFGDWQSRAPILLERESLRGDTPPSRETRKETAGTTADSTGSGERPVLETFSCGGIGAYSSSSSSPILASGADLGHGCEALIVARMVAFGEYSEDGADLVYALAGNTIGRKPENGGNHTGYDESGVAYTLTKTDVHGVCYGIDEECNAREEVFGPLLRGGNGGTHQAVCYPLDTQNMTEGHNSGGKGFGEDNDPSFTLTKGHSHAIAFEPGIAKREGGSSRFSEELSPTLRKEMWDNQIAVAFTQNTRDEVRYINGDGKIAGALAAQPGMKQTTYLAFHTNAQPDQMAFSAETSATLTKSQYSGVFTETTYVGGIDYENNGHTMDQPTGPLLKGSPTGGGRPLPAIVSSTSQVRRLTPIECARLQGFPDTYLDIEFKGKPAADGHKYKALGNSMAVPVMRYIGKRIKFAVSQDRMNTASVESLI